MTSKKKPLVTVRDFHQHLKGDDHGEGCATCEIRSYAVGDVYTGSDAKTALRRGLIAEGTNGEA